MIISIFKPAENCEGRPIAGFLVHAGFASPGEDHEEEVIDLNAYVSKYPHATFYAKVTGDCMENSGIYETDLLVVDRSLNHMMESGDIILGTLDGEFILTVYISLHGRQYLVRDNKNYPPYEINQYTNFTLEGLVSHTVTNQRKRRHVRAHRLQQLLRQLRAGIPAQAPKPGRRSA